MKHVILNFEITDNDILKSVTVDLNETNIDDSEILEPLAIGIIKGMKYNKQDCLNEAISIINKK